MKTLFFTLAGIFTIVIISYYFLVDKKKKGALAIPEKPMFPEIVEPETNPAPEVPPVPEEQPNLFK